MAQANDLTPSIDAVLEQENIGFDYGPVLDTGVTILAILNLIVEVEQNSVGQDPTPMARLLSLPQVIASRATGALQQGVAVLFGTAVAETTYVIQCVVQTSDGQRLSLWTRFLCDEPF